MNIKGMHFIYKLDSLSHEESPSKRNLLDASEKQKRNIIFKNVRFRTFSCSILVCLCNRQLDHMCSCITCQSPSSTTQKPSSVYSTGLYPHMRSANVLIWGRNYWCKYRLLLVLILHKKGPNRRLTTYFCLLGVHNFKTKMIDNLKISQSKRSCACKHIYLKQEVFNMKNI